MKIFRKESYSNTCTLALFKEIAGFGKLIYADLAELNPSLDQDAKTSKLAYEIITGCQGI